jgi:3-isopropylmalate dehydrogenase
VALLLDFLGFADAAAGVTAAVKADLASRGATAAGSTRSTSQIGDAIAEALAG